MARKPKLTPFNPHAGSICGQCADKNGGVWPEGHVATFWGGECSFCHTEGMLCCVTDWDFPKKGVVRKSDDIEREI